MAAKILQLRDVGMFASSIQDQKGRGSIFDEIKMMTLINGPVQASLEEKDRQEQIGGNKMAKTKIWASSWPKI